MNNPPDSLFRRLIGWSSTPHRSSGQPDPADMGTAIGLEFSLDQAPLPVTELQPHASTPHSAGGARGARRNWFGRRRPN